MLELSKEPRIQVSDERGLRLLSALQALVSEGAFVFTLNELARRAQVLPAMARLAVAEWLKRGWIEESKVRRKIQYVVRSKTPSAPGEAAIDALALLQIINMNEFRLGRLVYGYGSALAFHDLSELVSKEIYIFHSDPRVTSPKRMNPNAGSDPVTFQRTTKSPTFWGYWRGREVFLIRRSPNLLRPYQRALVVYQGVRAPCTTAIKSLIDAWVRPDLCGGLDRVSDAWNSFAENCTGPERVASDINAIMNDSSWPTMRGAFMEWLQGNYPQFVDY